MGAKQYAYINNEMLKWARCETPLQPEDVAIRIRDISEDNIKMWESGEELPSISIAKKLANLYDVPFASFYMTDVPDKAHKDYLDKRTFANPEEYETMSYELWKEIRYFKSCRESILMTIEDDYIGKNLPRINDNLDESIKIIREYFELDTPLKNKTAFGNNVFNYYRRIIESKGILVFQISGISTKEIRGLSLNYELFPIIAVNKNDSDRAKVFTMFHELAHLIRRTSALCLVDFSERNDREEKECDKIAGNILVPRSKLDELVKGIIDNDKIDYLSNVFGVSKFVILKRLYDDEKISLDFYKNKYDEFYENFMENRDAIEQSKNDKSFRIPYHVKYISTNGKLFPSIIINAYYEGKMSLGEICRTLNVKTKQIDRIERMVML